MDWSSVNWMNVGLLVAFAFVAALVGNVLSFNHRLVQLSTARRHCEGVAVRRALHFLDVLSARHRSTGNEIRLGTSIYIKNQLEFSYDLPFNAGRLPRLRRIQFSVHTAMPLWQSIQVAPFLIASGIICAASDCLCGSMDSTA